jgi:hypothetical protein
LSTRATHEVEANNTQLYLKESLNIVETWVDLVIALHHWNIREGSGRMPSELCGCINFSMYLISSIPIDIAVRFLHSGRLHFGVVDFNGSQ